MESVDSTTATCMSLNNKQKYLLLVWVILLSSCHIYPKIQPIEPQEMIRPRSALFILKQNEKTWMKYHHVGMKLEGTVVAGEEETGFKANVRMAKDSAVWFSISPALGIEVARALLTTDSLHLLSKIPDNKFGYQSTLTEIENWIHFEIDLADLQNILIGQPIGIDKIGGKFKSSVQDADYVINTRYKRRLKKNINFINQLGDSLEKAETEREKRKLQRIDQEGLIISQYWIDGSYFLLNKMQFTDLMTNKTITITYEDWNNENPELTFPTKGSIAVLDGQEKYLFLWEINKVVNDRLFDFPFEIPEDYEIKKKL